MKTNLTTTRNTARQQGSALLSVMVILTLLMAVVGSTYAISRHRSHQTQVLTEFIHAHAIAEAGANEAYSRLRTHFYSTPRGTESPQPFADGAYEVTIEDNPHVVRGVRITSVGTYRNAESVVGMDLRDANTSSIAFDYAIFANGPLRFNGTPPIIDGDLHTNNDWTLSGNYGGVQGLISAQNYEDIPEEFRAVWQVIPFPQLSDPAFQEFLAAAEADGRLTRYTGNRIFQQSHEFNGIVVVEGNVTFRGSGVRTINGMLYVTGDVTSNGSSTVDLNGVLMAGGQIRFNGASGVFTHGNVDNSGGDESADVQVSAWWLGD